MIRSGILRVASAQLAGKKRKCKVCRSEFVRTKPMQTVCSLDCSVRHAQLIREKNDRAAAKQVRESIKERKESAKTKTDWLNDAQALLNKIIKIRDFDDPCISCGRYHDGQWHAGHYRGVKAMSYLRFNRLNIHKQCQPCNTHLSGNIVEYRMRLFKKIGVENLEMLEKDYPPLRMSIDEIKAFIAELKVELKELQS